VLAVLIRGDRTLNEVKLKNYLGAQDLELAGQDEVERVSQAPQGFAGPKDLKVDRIYADLELQAGTNWVTGANRADTHLVHVDLERDASIAAYADLRDVTEGDLCPKCSAGLDLPRGIEVGHVFNLGTKYSSPMQAIYLDENGKEQEMVMGCYGIGVSRILAAAIEQNHDAAGMVLPPQIAPYDLALLCLDINDEAIRAKAEELYQSLQDQGLDVLFDDRQERPGVKFHDADLIGLPLRLLVGRKGLARGVVEAKDRLEGQAVELPINGFEPAFEAWRQQVLLKWQGLARG
jgi:prolyl-tRNA synthetase